MIIGDRLRALREQKNLSQGHLGVERGNERLPIGRAPRANPHCRRLVVSCRRPWHCYLESKTLATAGCHPHCDNAAARPTISRSGEWPCCALSLDGTHLAYVARQGGAQQLYLRAMDSLEARPIPGTEGAVNPFFSPDGQWLGFFAAGKLKKVPVNGGAALTLGDAAFPHGASWGNHGTIAFVPENLSVLQ